jgi:hypothetical protein
VDDVARAAALALSAVFAVAAVAKVLHHGATVRSFGALGLPVPGVLSIAVPVVEAALAVSLLTWPAVGAWASIALLVAFTAVLARAVARGVDAPCACFGSARGSGDGGESVSSVELVRNAMLAALAVIASGASAGVGGGGVLVRWPSLPALVMVSVAVCVGRVVLALLELRRHGRVWPEVPSP